ncbi:DUF4440 domain-containing protein [Novosphingobium sp. 1949]|uniref:DUF4440 domain-containing protein n=1 Tax=Novosphingobium organovorum TaxID=2930092 RepID=A0ABT0BFB1_9SPHN|nr:DUF4440 domain-containing protein [Novosphingobium organovorum]MCJ2183760.1 DUF4440 domain-containing protein [Novosphingobium organovorum]
MKRDDKAAELAIRTRRAEFNRAIAEGDCGAIGPILARDCVMVTGSDSAVIAGRLAQVKVWKRDFSQAGRLVYARRTQRVESSRVEPIAMEYGDWEGRVAGQEGASASNGASGTYVAKWRESAAGWVIEAEIFLTLA